MLLPCTLVAGRLLSVDTVVGGIVVDMVGCDMVGCVVVEARHKQLFFPINYLPPPCLERGRAGETDLFLSWGPGMNWSRRTGALYTQLHPMFTVMFLTALTRQS